MKTVLTRTVQSIGITLALFLQGCSSIGFNDSNPDDEPLSKEQEQASNLFEIRNEASTLFNIVEANELKVYAPTHFDQAQSAFNEIDDPSTSEENAQVQLKRLQTSKELGDKLKPLVVQHLNETAIAYKHMLNLGIKNTHPTSFSTLQKRWYSEVEALESNPKNEPNKESAESLKTSMIELIKKDLKTSMLSPTLSTLGELKKSDTPIYAPKSFEKAEIAVSQMENVLREHPDDIELITAAHEHAQRSLKQAQNIGNIARSWVGMTKPEAETEVENIINQLHLIGMAMGEPDHRHLGIQAQVAALTQAAEVQRKRAQAFALEPGWSDERKALINRIKTLEQELAKAKRQAK